MGRIFTEAHDGKATLGALDTMQIDIAKHITDGINSFCCGIVHELRSPLQAIENSIFLLSETINPNDEIANMSITTIKNSVDAMNGILSSLTALEGKGKDPLAIVIRDKGTYDLYDVVTEAIELFKLTSTHKECQTTLTLNCPCNTQANFSAFAVKQILINLLSNSSKSCMRAKGRGEGNINVDIVNQNGSIAILVQDDGIGVHDSIKEKIFLPMFKGSHDIPGKGIGLHLSKLWSVYSGMNLELVNGCVGKTVFALIMPSEENGE